MISFLSKTQVRNLVIADDDRDDQALFKEVIEESNPGISVSTVFDGEQLIELLKNSPVLPDLVLLDMNMPNKNGLECISEIRKEERFKALPVVFLSTSRDLTDILNGYDRGANLFFSKPNNFGLIRNLINSLLIINWKHFPDSLDKSYFTQLAVEGTDLLLPQRVTH